MDTSTSHRALETPPAARDEIPPFRTEERPGRKRWGLLLAGVGAAMMLLSLLWPGPTLTASVPSESDTTNALFEEDEPRGGTGEDVMIAGSDLREVAGGGRDGISCDPGIDLDFVNADLDDTAAADCETVYVPPAPRSELALR
ncbi:MAG: hypothetical protein ACR2KW_01720 [Rubrobacter sp.]